jgi:murein DD-endopeptidase MepM/ murein hydrolase activator NlpD
MHNSTFDLAAAAALILVCAAPVALAQSKPPAKSSRPVAIVIKPPAKPVAVFIGDDKAHVIYEIGLTNYDRRALKIDQFNLSAEAPEGCAPVSLSFKGKDLAAILSSVSADKKIPQEPLLHPSESAILFLMQTFSAPRCAPASISNSLVVESADHTAPPQLITAPATELTNSAPIVISAPIRGDNWLSGNGPSNFSDHRRAVLVLGGTPWIAQRFAEDWVVVDGHGHTFSGDKSQNKSYHCYDQPILAVANGTAVEVNDGIVENTPSPAWDPPNPPAVPIDLETVAGNHIVEDLGGGRYALYAHMIPGSLKLKPGDKIARGDQIGKVGNSGNSTEPHLHFQVMDGPAPLCANGLPFAIDNFVRYSYKFSYEAKDQPSAMTIDSREEVRDQAVMNDDIGSYGL